MKRKWRKIGERGESGGIIHVGGEGRIRAEKETKLIRGRDMTFLGTGDNCNLQHADVLTVL